MKTSGVAITALIIAIIAFIGMIATALGVDELQGRISQSAFKENYIQENYIPIVSFDDDVLNEALLTEEQRQAGVYLYRRNDGRVQLWCRNGAYIATFDTYASVSEVRYAADIEMMKYWAGTSECLEDAGE